jgi:hypothetical protein
LLEYYHYLLVKKVDYLIHHHHQIPQVSLVVAEQREPLHLHLRYWL